MVSIRPARDADAPAIAAVVTAAFGGPAEAGIIERARLEDAVLVDLVAEADGRIVGHVLFSRMRAESHRFIAALGPLAVAPAHQHTGVGSALTRVALATVEALGAEAVVVLGHPTYYPRFGFSAEAARHLESPYAGSPAFMALAFKPGALDRPLKVDYPAAFG